MAKSGADSFAFRRPPERLHQLGIDRMVMSKTARAFRTDFHVRCGRRAPASTTGISAADRARTIKITGRTEGGAGTPRASRGTYFRCARVRGRPPTRPPHRAALDLTPRRGCHPWAPLRNHRNGTTAPMARPAAVAKSPKKHRLKICTICRPDFENHGARGRNWSNASKRETARLRRFRFASLPFQS